MRALIVMTVLAAGCGAAAAATFPTYEPQLLCPALVRSGEMPSVPTCVGLEENARATLVSHWSGYPADVVDGCLARIEQGLLVGSAPAGSYLTLLRCIDAYVEGEAFTKSAN